MKVVEYEFSRLCFKADVIEPLGENDTFIVHTPTDVTEFGIVTETKFLQPEKAYLGIVVTELGKTIKWRFLHPEKA